MTPTAATSADRSVSCADRANSGCAASTSGSQVDHRGAPGGATANVDHTGHVINGARSEVEPVAASAVADRDYQRAAAVLAFTAAALADVALVISFKVKLPMGPALLLLLLADVLFTISAGSATWAAATGSVRRRRTLCGVTVAGSLIIGWPLAFMPLGAVVFYALPLALTSVVAVRRRWPLWGAAAVTVAAGVSLIAWRAFSAWRAYRSL